MRIGLLHEGDVALTWALDGGPLRVGRAATNDLVLPHLDVSGHHAVLHARDGRVWVTDLRSVNGTFVGEARIQQPTPLELGGHVRFGAHAVLVVLDDGTVAATLVVQRDDGLAGWPLTPAGLVLPCRWVVVLEDGIPWLTSELEDDRELVVGESFEAGGVRYRLLDAPPAVTTERLEHPSDVLLTVDLLGGSAVVECGEQRCVVGADHRVALLHALGHRWLQDPMPNGGWLTDDELAVAVWGRRYRTHGSNNLHVLVHRVRAEVAAAGFDRSLLQKRTGRTRLQVKQVVLR